MKSSITAEEINKLSKAEILRLLFYPSKYDGQTLEILKSKAFQLI